MKKWLIILTIIFSIGFITSAVLAGQVYYKEMVTYTDYDKQTLDKGALKNIYINSDVPVQVEPTTGEAYVEFSQTFTDLLGLAPEFKLDVRTKDNRTYIDLEQVKEIHLWIGVQKDETMLTVYLPEGDYDSLSIEEDIWRYMKRSSINLEGLNIKEVELDVSNSEIKLKGNYSLIGIESQNGSLEVESLSESQLEVEGNTDINLFGQYKSIVIADNYNPDIIIETTLPAELKLDVDSAYVKLRGKYSEVDIEGSNNRVDAKSESSCKVVVDGYDYTLDLNGAIKDINVNAHDSEVEVRTTIIPERIKMLIGGYEKATLTLPSNIPGLKLRLVGDSYYYDEEYYYNLIDKNVSSDFTLAYNNADSEFKYYYGDGTIPVIVTEYVNLQLIDGGYSSETK